jgi:DNA-binding MarR family transcriptional regulator
MADTIRFLTMAPGPGAPAAISDDSVPHREALERFRAVGVDQEPNRGQLEAARAVGVDQEPNTGQLETARAVGVDQEPNRGQLERSCVVGVDQEPNRGRDWGGHPGRALDPAPEPESELEPEPEPDRDPELDRDLDTGVAAPSLETRLLDHVWRIAQSAARHSDGVLQWTYEYSLPQILVLRAIVAAERSGRPALSPSDVAHELKCSRANASELVAALVRNQKLTKRRDPENRRIIRLHPTTDGRTLEYHARAVLADNARQVFATLEGPEKETLVSLLEKVTFFR